MPKEYLTDVFVKLNSKSRNSLQYKQLAVTEHSVPPNLSTIINDDFLYHSIKKCLLKTYLIANIEMSMNDEVGKKKKWSHPELLTHLK